MPKASGAKVEPPSEPVTVPAEHAKHADQPSAPHGEEDCEEEEMVDDDEIEEVD